MIDWSEFINNTNQNWIEIQFNLNTTFQSLDLPSYLIQLQQKIELKLQYHVVSIASQQRKIARMHRQLSVATELLNQYAPNQYVPVKIYVPYYVLLFGLIIGILY